MTAFPFRAFPNPLDPYPHAFSNAVDCDPRALRPDLSPDSGLQLESARRSRKYIRDSLCELTKERWRLWNAKQFHRARGEWSRLNPVTVNARDAAVLRCQCTKEMTNATVTLICQGLFGLDRRLMRGTPGAEVILSRGGLLEYNKRLMRGTSGAARILSQGGLLVFDRRLLRGTPGTRSMQRG